MELSGRRLVGGGRRGDCKVFGRRESVTQARLLRARRIYLAYSAETETVRRRIGEPRRDSRAFAILAPVRRGLAAGR
jgi:hypothetical protein